MKRNVFITTGAFLVVTLLITGYVAVAAEYGSKDDPLVTLSYIKEVFLPETKKYTTDAVNGMSVEYQSEINSKLSDISSNVDKKLIEMDSAIAGLSKDKDFVKMVADIVSANASTSKPEDSWRVVEIANGKTVTTSIGTEILLRIGTATCVASGSPGLINLSSAKEILNGSPLEKNNLYLTTIEGRGFKTTAKSTFLIKGDYTVK